MESSSELARNEFVLTTPIQQPLIILFLDDIQELLLEVFPFGGLIHCRYGGPGGGMKCSTQGPSL
jgi:hypothetical protein